MNAAAVNTSDDSPPERARYRRSAGSPRGEARRRELLDRVTDDLAVNGLVDFSLRRAARAAGTTHKVLLYHFDGADDLLNQAIFLLRERRIGNALAAMAREPGPQTLAARVRIMWAGARSGDRTDHVRLRPLRRTRARGLAAVPADAAVRLPSGLAGAAQESGGQPRQVQRVREQLADWQAAARNAARHQRPLALLRFAGRGIADAAAAGAPHRPARDGRVAHHPGCL
jgi:AcrR family transcriptional regulator